MNHDSPQYMAALRDFRRARQRALLERILARLTRRSADLLDYDEVREKLHAGEAVPRGLQTIPLDAIVGSVGRYTDFTRSFLPQRKSAAPRWAAVKMALTDVQDLPPITVYQIGQAYFVLDGNHRVSIARQAGAKQIQAYVTEVETKVPLSANVQPDDLICQAQYADFLAETGLDETRPSADFTVSAPGQYQVLQAQIAEQQRELRAAGRDLSFQETAVHWYDEVYLPVIELIRERGILRHFPGRTETDLYVWMARNQDELQQSLGWEVQSETVISDLVTRLSTTPQQTLARVRARIREAMTPEPLEAGPSPGQWRREHRQAERLFQDILAPIHNTETGWRTLAQAIALARREGGRLHGLYVMSGDSVQARQKAQAIESEFNERCHLAGVEGDFSAVPGQIMPQIFQHGRWADLVVYTIAHPPQERPLARLSSNFHTLIRQSARPVLVVPGPQAQLVRPLLAYDGSPKAKEALFVAAYLAGKWPVPLVVATVSERNQRAAAAVEDARNYLVARSIPATFVVEQGPVTEAVEKTAVAHNCDFIIMGGYGFKPLLEVVMGSTVDEILRLRRWPVLICR